MMIAAVATYLAHRRVELEDDPGEILRLAAKAEFGRHVPQDVESRLAARGVVVQPGR
jgi:hypothetical protein